MRRFLLASWILTSLFAAGVASQTPQQLPRLQASDIRYLGSSVVPSSCAPGGGTAQALTFSSGGLGLGPTGLILNGHDQASGIIAQISKPEPGKAATLLTPCYQVPNLASVDGGAQTKIGGALWYGGRLIHSAYSYYDADGNAWLSHAATTIHPNGTLSTSPWQQVGQLGGGYVGGYMGLIPQEWQALLGGPAFTGQCCLSIISRTNAGPSFAVFDPARIGTTSGVVPAQPLLYYPLSNPIADPNVQNPYFTFADVGGGVAFPAGTRSVLFISRHGQGPSCYGDAAPCGDPAGQYKGFHTYPYVYQVTAFDALDLVAVKNGQTQPYDVRPYATWTLPGITSTTASLPDSGGVTYDPTTKRLYLMTRYSEQPRLHIYQVDVPNWPPPPPPPLEVCGDGIDNNGNGQIDEGCPPPSSDLFEQVDTITIPASSVTVPAQTITRTLLCSRSKGTCVVK